jgi:hypothetical protein
MSFVRVRSRIMSMVCTKTVSAPPNRIISSNGAKNVSMVAENTKRRPCIA